jgi:hypothetical protein
MTNRLALWLGGLLVLLILGDVILFGTDHMLFLGRKMLELIEWMAFWR